MEDPFHDGERAIQEQVGVRNAALRLARLISEHIPPGAMKFITQQRFCVLGQIDHKGDIWAHIVTGGDGFANASKDGTIVSIHSDSLLFSPKPGDPVGVLFIDLAHRMRLRVNGTLSACHTTSLDIQVKEAFPNCPKYIQQRQSTTIARAKPRENPQQGDKLTPAHIDWIKNADTFFVASALRAGPTDVSHRGGKPGFVHVNGGVLSIPDYPGNSMFGTLGNLAQNPQAGLVFVDFARGLQLLMTGTVQLDLDAGDNKGNTGGTGRWWHFTPQQWVTRPLHPAMTWRLTEPSPFNP